jgi:hypothetical protein
MKKELHGGARAVWVPVVSLLASSILATPALAAQASISVNPPLGHPSQPVVVTGSGFGANETVRTTVRAGHEP